MIKETIKYVDYNGNERTEDFYFNLNKAELTEMELGTEGTYTQYLEKIVNTKDTPSMVKTFKEIVLKSYGVKSPDGKRFIKSKELAEEFCQTEAYSELFIKLMTEENAMVNFVNGIIPNEIVKELNKPSLPANVTNA